LLVSWDRFLNNNSQKQQLATQSSLNSPAGRRMIDEEFGSIRED